MRRSFAFLVLASAIIVAGPASAYSLECKDGSNPCQAYNLKCKDGTFVGTIFWNGTQWSDGLRWDKDIDVVAKKMVAAWGAACE